MMISWQLPRPQSVSERPSSRSKSEPRHVQDSQYWRSCETPQREVPRIHLPRTPGNKGKKMNARGEYTPAR